MPAQQQAADVSGNYIGQLHRTNKLTNNVTDRDGIGIEIYPDNKLVIEIFRDDTKCTRNITLCQQDISLDLLEEGIQIFKKEIPCNFIDYDNFK